MHSQRYELIVGVPISCVGFCGVSSILTSLRYCLGDPADKRLLYIALAFLPFGMFFDFLDGRVARWRKKSSMMGQELDSLADLVRVPAFLVSPPWRGTA